MYSVCLSVVAQTFALPSTFIFWPVAVNNLGKLDLLSVSLLNFTISSLMFVTKHPVSAVALIFNGLPLSWHSHNIAVGTSVLL